MRQRQMQRQRMLNGGGMGAGMGAGMGGGMGGGWGRRRGNYYNVDSDAMVQPSVQPQPTGWNGPGTQIGGVTVTVAPQPSNYAAPQPSFESLPFGVRPTIDPNIERTMIKITLSTGQQTTIELNTTATVGDIHNYVRSVNPSVSNYQLISGYPPAPLLDPQMTIASANLR